MLMCFIYTDVCAPLACLVPEEARKDIRSPGTGIMDVCQLSWVCWESNLGLSGQSGSVIRNGIITSQGNHGWGQQHREATAVWQHRSEAISHHPRTPLSAPLLRTKAAHPQASADSGSARGHFHQENSNGSEDFFTLKKFTKYFTRCQ